ncbi:hypothetical protein [Spirochaeta cellobiosiphila]|uniref:hypothetical protein n=1 Tax=Spirochaeta cellobiosiphila TaxID=504483 RepID=UPI000408342F|nr:hypothetical protein [Spirochaeta cellobiosiphila]
MKSTSRFGSLMILQIALGVFIFILGLNGIIHYNSTFSEASRAVSQLFGGGNNQTLNLIVAVVELIAGVILVGGVFLPIDSKALFFAGFIVFILWALRIVMFSFLDGFLKPDLLPWLQSLALDVVVLVGLWSVSTSYK